MQHYLSNDPNIIITWSISKHLLLHRTHIQVLHHLSLPPPPPFILAVFSLGVGGRNRRDFVAANARTESGNSLLDSFFENFFECVEEWGGNWYP